MVNIPTPGAKRRGKTLVEDFTLTKNRKCHWCGKTQKEGQVVIRCTNTTTKKVTAVFCDMDCMNNVQYAEHAQKNDW